MTMPTRLAILFTLIAAWASPVWAADPTVEQLVSAYSSGSAASVTTTGVTTTTSNAFICAASAFGNTTGGATPISDSKGNTWTQAIASAGTGEGWLTVWYVLNATGGASHTFTFTPTSSDFVAVGCLEVSGLATSGALNHTTTLTSSSSTKTTSSVSADAGIRELFIAAAAISDATGNISIGGGHDISASPLNMTGVAWNGRYLTAGGSNEGILLAWRLIPSGGSATFSWSDNIIDHDATALMGFKAATAGGGGETAAVF